MSSVTFICQECGSKFAAVDEAAACSRRDKEARRG